MAIYNDKVYYLGGTEFFGNPISEYGLKHNRVDYAAFARSFEAVLNNEIIGFVTRLGYFFEPVNGRYNYDAEIEELREQLEELEPDSEEYEAIEEQIAEYENWAEPDIFQWYIIDEHGVDMIKNFAPDEPLYYCEELDMYLWGVTHYGTSWSYVLTDICLPKDEAERNEIYKTLYGV